jgi:SAM-dependent methyltransferase
MVHHTCPVCSSTSSLHDVVDFNKSCEEPKGKFLPKSGVPVYYALCESCDFLFAPEFAEWTEADFLLKIYNDEYVAIDPDYVEARPHASFNFLQKYFGQAQHEIQHLDYGGGNGLLSSKLMSAGWNSKSYDPFPERNIDISSLGKFNLITAFEVFEHVPDPQLLLENIHHLLDETGLVLFSTLVNDGNIKRQQRLDWWYASPRNGHISLFSKKSLKILGEKYGFHFGSMGTGLHCYYKKFPSWANSIAGK